MAAASVGLTNIIVIVGLRINEKQTQVMAVGKTDTKLNIWLDGGRLEQVKEFTYLGSLMTDDDKCINDIEKHVGLASAVIGQLYKIWKSKEITIKTKFIVYQVLVMPVLLYGAECWTMRKEDE